MNTTDYDLLCNIIDIQFDNTTDAFRIALLFMDQPLPILHLDILDRCIEIKSTPPSKMIGLAKKHIPTSLVEKINKHRTSSPNKAVDIENIFCSKVIFQIENAYNSTEEVLNTLHPKLPKQQNPIPNNLLNLYSQQRYSDLSQPSYKHIKKTYPLSDSQCRTLSKLSYSTTIRITPEKNIANPISIPHAQLLHLCAIYSLIYIHNSRLPHVSNPTLCRRLSNILKSSKKPINIGRKYLEKNLCRHIPHHHKLTPLSKRDWETLKPILDNPPSELITAIDNEYSMIGESDFTNRLF